MPILDAHEPTLESEDRADESGRRLFDDKPTLGLNDSGLHCGGPPAEVRQHVAAVPVCAVGIAVTHPPRLLRRTGPNPLVE